MKIMMLLTLTASFLLAGCANREAQRTLEANHILVSTQIADLRITATVQAARARTTVDFVETRAAVAATKGQLLEATLVAYGIPVEAVQTYRARVLGNRSTTTPSPTHDPAALPQLTTRPQSSPTPLPLTITPTAPVVTPFSLLLTPTSEFLPADPDAPHLENPVTAAAVDSDDCAINITSQFETTSAEIYIVAEAVNAPAGTIIEARWFREGESIGPIYSFAPDFDIERACIWFFVDPTDFEFLPGVYAVDLVLNGEPASPSIAFTIAAP